MEQLIVRMKSDKSNPSRAWGQLLHGMLMERLPAPWPELLHTQDLHPFSQWIRLVNDSEFDWHLNILEDPLAELIREQVREGSCWHSSHLDREFRVLTLQREQMTFEEYVKGFFVNCEPLRGVRMTFETTTTHKVNGRYVIFPSVDLIANYLRRKICAIEPDFALADEHAMEDILRNSYIARYRLDSTRFAMDKSWVNGYCGEIDVHFTGPDALRRLAGVLFCFAEWSGVGVKTSMGLGGCTVKKLPDRRHGNP